MLYPAQGLAAELKALAVQRFAFTGYRYHFILAGENLVLSWALILQSVLKQIVRSKKREM